MPDFLNADASDDYLVDWSNSLQDDPKAAAQYPHVPPLALGGFLDTASTQSGGGGERRGTAALADPSSPELTSDSASPSSSDGNAQANVPITAASANEARGSPGVPKARGRRSSPTRAGQGLSAQDPKRKNGAGNAGAIKDHRRTSDSGAGHHSHATVNDGVTARSESPDDSLDGKGDKGKTSERRKAQNRQAQRNFRERKEKHLKDLEERVVVLEQETKDRDAENAALKQLLENLQSENARLKVYETAFTFDYDKDVSGSSAMSQSSAFRPAESISSSPSDVAGTSGTSGDSAAFRFDSGPSAAGSTLSSTSSNTADSSSLLADPTSPDIKPSSTALESAVPPVSSEANDALFLSSFVNTTPSPFASLSGLPISSPGAMPSDPYKSYRDPLASLGMPSSDLSTFADLDALLAGPDADLGRSAAPNAFSPDTQDALAAFLNPSPPAFSSGAQSFSSSGQPSPVPASTTATSTVTSATPSFASDFGLGGAGAGTHTSPTCSLTGGAVSADALSKLHNRPDAHGKFEFDLDGLCSEMKLKATCQEAARQALQQAMREDAAASRQTYPSAQL
ncbi:DNA-binding transcription factor yap1 [Rhodotorula sphaerocarpa]